MAPQKKSALNWMLHTTRPEPPPVVGGDSPSAPMSPSLPPPSLSHPTQNDDHPSSSRSAQQTSPQASPAANPPALPSPPGPSVPPTKSQGKTAEEVCAAASGRPFPNCDPDARSWKISPSTASRLARNDHKPITAAFGNQSDIPLSANTSTFLPSPSPFLHQYLRR